MLGKQMPLRLAPRSWEEADSQPGVRRRRRAPLRAPLATFSLTRTDPVMTGKLLPAVRGNWPQSSRLETTPCGTQQHHLHPSLPHPAPTSAHQQPQGTTRKSQPRAKMLHREPRCLMLSWKVPSGDEDLTWLCPKLRVPPSPSAAEPCVWLDLHRNLSWERYPPNPPY